MSQKAAIRRRKQYRVGFSGVGVKKRIYSRAIPHTVSSNTRKK